MELFNSIKPLFVNKPLVIAVNKIDLTAYDELTPEEKAMLEGMAADNNVEIMPMSTLMERGIFEVRDRACDKLLAHRVEAKLKGKDLDSILSRVALSVPQARDDMERPAFIPEGVLERRINGVSDDFVLEKTIEAENGGSGVYQADLKAAYMLESEDWNHDKVPEILDGVNIADYVDPAILEKLDALEEEEEQLMAEAEAESDESDLDDDLVENVRRIRDKKAIIRAARSLRSNNHMPLGRHQRRVDVDAVARDLKARGVDEEGVERARSKSRGRALLKPREGSRSASMRPEEWQLEKARGRSMSEARALSEARNRSGGILGKRSRSVMERSMTPARNSSVRNVRRRIDAQTDETRSVKVITNAEGRVGEADRRVYSLKPKHLFSGKRTIGKTERR